MLFSYETPERGRSGTGILWDSIEEAKESILKYKDGIFRPENPETDFCGSLCTE